MAQKFHSDLKFLGSNNIEISGGIIDNLTGDLVIQNSVDDSDIIFKSDDINLGSGTPTEYFRLDGSTRKVEYSVPLHSTSSAHFEAESGVGIYGGGYGTFSISNQDDSYHTVFGYDGGAFSHIDGQIVLSDYGSGNETTGTAAYNLAVTSDGTLIEVSTVDEADSAKRIEVDVKNVFGAAMTKGTVVHVQPTGTLSGNVIEVVKADADVAANMPAIAVLNEDLAINAEGKAVMFGTVQGIDTSSFSVGDELYVSTTAGEFTATKPTATTELIQKIAVVIKSHASNGLIKVFGAGRSNDVPNQINRNVNFTDDSWLTFGDSTDLRIYHNSSNSSGNIWNTVGHLNIQNTSDDKDIVFLSDDGAGGNAEYFRVDGGSVLTYFSKPLQMADNEEIFIGSAGDLQIYHDSTNSIVTNTTGDLRFIQNADDKDIVFYCDDGSGNTTVYFYLDGSEGLNRFQKNILIPDSVSISLGSSFDLQLYHDGGTQSLISNTTGDLIIQNTADDKDILFYSDDGSGGTALYFQIDGSAVLNKFIKDSKHVDNVKAIFGDSSDLQIYHDGSNSYITDSGAGYLLIRGSNQIRLSNATGTQNYFVGVDNGQVELSYSGSKKFETITSGAIIYNNLGLNGATPAYTIDTGETTTGTLRMVGDANHTFIRLGAGGGGNDVTLIRVDGQTNSHDGESDSSQFGFSLKYLGSLSGNENALALYADNSQAASQVESFRVKQDGTLHVAQNATFEGNVISKDTFYLENASGKRWQQLFDGNNWNIRYYNGSSWSADALAIDTSNNATFAGDVLVSGNLTVNGTTTTINSQTVSVDDKNIELGDVADTTGVTATLATLTAVVTVSSTTGFLVGATLTKTAGTGAFGAGAVISSIDSPTQFTASVNHATAGAITFTVGGASNATADGGGLTLKAATDKTILWTSSTNTWDFNTGATFAGQITTTQNQITTNIGTTSAIRLKPSSTTNTTGKSSIFLGTSPVDNYGISLRGARLGTNGTPTFELATHNNSANGTVALSIDNSQNSTFYGNLTLSGGRTLFIPTHAGIEIDLTGSNGGNIRANSVLYLLSQTSTVEIGASGTNGILSIQSDKVHSDQPLFIECPNDQILTLDQTGGGWNYIGFESDGTRNFYVGQDSGENFIIGADSAKTFQFSNFSSLSFAAAQLNSTGNVLPNVDSTYNVGSSSLRYANIFADTIDCANVKLTNVVTNRILKFDGTDIDDSNLTDNGSLVTSSVNFEIAKHNPVIELNDNSSPDDTDMVSYISLQRGGTEKGWMGYGSSGNANLTLKNTVGNIAIHSSSAIDFTGGSSIRSNSNFSFLTTSNAAQTGRFKSLQVSTSYQGTIPDNGILFGTDTNLYRYSANWLKTDDNFIVEDILLVNHSTDLTSQALQVRGFIDITNVGSTALRWYDGSTFRGGLGTDLWADGGNATDLTMYVSGTNAFHTMVNNTKITKVHQSGLDVLSSTAKLSLDGSSFSGIQAFNGEAHINMDVRAFGTDGVAFHKYNRGYSSGSFNYRPYYERWYDGDSYHDIGIEGNRFQMNTGLNIDGITTIGKDSQSGNAQLTVKSTAGGNTGIILIEGDTTNDGWGVYATTANDYVITRFTNGSYSDKFTINSSGDLFITGDFQVTGTGKFYSAIGTADDVRTGLAHYDTTSQTAGVGGQLVLGYIYTGTTYTEGAILKTYKENSTSSHYGSGLKFQVRNHGAALSTKMHLNPSGSLVFNKGVGTYNTGGFGDPKIVVKQTTNSDWGGLNIEANGNDSVFSFSNTDSAHMIAGSYRATAGFKDIVIKTGGQERMRFDADATAIGFFGQTSPTVYSGYGVLHIGTSSTKGLIKFGNGNTSNGPEIYALESSGSNLRFNTDSSTNVMNLVGSRVGVRTVNPKSTVDLDVNGGVQASNLTLENARFDGSQEYPIGHYTGGKEIWSIDTHWTNQQLQDYFNNTGVEWYEDSTAPGGYAIAITGGVYVGGDYNSGFPYIPVDEDAIYYMECHIRSWDGADRHYMGSIDYNHNFSSLGGNPGSFGYWVMSNTQTSTSWTKVSGIITGFGTSVGTFKSGTRYWTPQALFNYGNVSGTRKCVISGWRVIRIDKQEFFANGTNSVPSIAFAGDTNTGIYRPGSDQLGLVSGGSRKLMVESTGVQINNGFLDISTGNTIRLFTGAGNLRGYIQATDTDDKHLAIATSGGEDIAFLDGGTSGSINAVIRGDGNFIVAGDVIAYGSPSDKTLKENIKPLNGALDKVEKLQGVTFDWKKEDITNIKKDIGFIAQDVQKVLPELVRENDNGKLSMRHQGVIPVLVEAIKELKEEIEELKKQIK